MSELQLQQLFFPSELLSFDSSSSTSKQQLAGSSSLSSDSSCVPSAFSTSLSFSATSSSCLSTSCSSPFYRDFHASREASVETWGGSVTSPSSSVRKFILRDTTNSEKAVQQEILSAPASTEGNNSEKPVFEVADCSSENKDQTHSARVPAIETYCEITCCADTAQPLQEKFSVDAANSAKHHSYGLRLTGVTGFENRDDSGQLMEPDKDGGPEVGEDTMPTPAFGLDAASENVAGINEVYAPEKLEKECHEQAILNRGKTSRDPQSDSESQKRLFSSAQGDENNQYASNCGSNMESSYEYNLNIFRKRLCSSSITFKDEAGYFMSGTKKTNTDSGDVHCRYEKDIKGYLDMNKSAFVSSEDMSSDNSGHSSSRSSSCLSVRDHESGTTNTEVITSGIRSFDCSSNAGNGGGCHCSDAASEGKIQQHSADGCCASLCVDRTGNSEVTKYISDRDVGSVVDGDGSLIAVHLSEHEKSNIKDEDDAIKGENFVDSEIRKSKDGDSGINYDNNADREICCHGDNSRISFSGIDCRLIKDDSNDDSETFVSSCGTSEIGSSRGCSETSNSKLIICEITSANNGDDEVKQTENCGRQITSDSKSTCPISNGHGHSSEVADLKNSYSTGIGSNKAICDSSTNDCRVSNKISDNSEVCVRKNVNNKANNSKRDDNKACECAASKGNGGSDSSSNSNCDAHDVSNDHSDVCGCCCGHNEINNNKNNVEMTCKGSDNSEMSCVNADDRKNNGMNNSAYETGHNKDDRSGTSCSSSDHDKTNSCSEAAINNENGYDEGGGSTSKNRDCKESSYGDSYSGRCPNNNWDGGHSEISAAAANNGDNETSSSTNGRTETAWGCRIHRESAKNCDCNDEAQNKSRYHNSSNSQIDSSGGDHSETAGSDGTSGISNDNKSPSEMSDTGLNSAEDGKIKSPNNDIGINELQNCHNKLAIENEYSDGCISSTTNAKCDGERSSIVSSRCIMETKENRRHASIEINDASNCCCVSYIAGDFSEKSWNTTNASNCQIADSLSGHDEESNKVECGGDARMVGTQNIRITGSRENDSTKNSDKNRSNLNSSTTDGSSALAHAHNDVQSSNTIERAAASGGSFNCYTNCNSNKTAYDNGEYNCGLTTEGYNCAVSKTNNTNDSDSKRLDNDLSAINECSTMCSVFRSSCSGNENRNMGEAFSGLGDASKSNIEILSDKDIIEYYEDAAKKNRMQIMRELGSSLDINANPQWPPIKRNNVCKLHEWQTRRIRGRSSKLEDLETEKKRGNYKMPQWEKDLATLFNGIETRRSTLGRKAGLGLFATRSFKKNMVITEYVGWTIDRDLAVEMRKKRQASHIVKVEYQHQYIAGERTVQPFIGGASFANDGSKDLGGPGNNVTWFNWFDPSRGRNRVFIKATRDIQVGEEIFVAYHRDYWLDVEEEDGEAFMPENRSKKYRRYVAKMALKTKNLKKLQDKKKAASMQSNAENNKREKKKIKGSTQCNKESKNVMNTEKQKRERDNRILEREKAKQNGHVVKTKLVKHETDNVEVSQRREPPMCIQSDDEGCPSSLSKKSSGRTKRRKRKRTDENDTSVFPDAANSYRTNFGIYSKLYLNKRNRGNDTLSRLINSIDESAVYNVHATYRDRETDGICANDDRAQETSRNDARCEGKETSRNDTRCEDKETSRNDTRCEDKETSRNDTRCEDKETSRNDTRCEDKETSRNDARCEDKETSRNDARCEDKETSRNDARCENKAPLIILIKNEESKQLTYQHNENMEKPQNSGTEEKNSKVNKNIQTNAADTTEIKAVQCTRESPVGSTSDNNNEISSRLLNSSINNEEKRMLHASVAEDEITSFKDITDEERIKKLRISSDEKKVAIMNTKFSKAKKKLPDNKKDEEDAELKNSVNNAEDIIRQYDSSCQKALNNKTSCQEDAILHNNNSRNEDKKKASHFPEPGQRRKRTAYKKKQGKYYTEVKRKYLDFTWFNNAKAKLENKRKRVSKQTLERRQLKLEVNCNVYLEWSD